MVSIAEVRNDNERSVLPDTPGWEKTHQGMIFFQHVFAYESALANCKGARVLEVGCGSGYGAQIIGKVADSVLAIDVSESAIAWANQHNQLSNVAYRGLKLESPELDHQQFDVIISYQVIEHVFKAELPQFLNRFAQLLAPNGVALLTTPNRLRRLPLLQKPWNPYHVQEYSAQSLEATLAKYFRQVDIRYITGNEHVMAGEWARGARARVTPLRYYGTGMVAGLVANAFGALLSPLPTWQKQASTFILHGERALGSIITRNPFGKWDQTRPFASSDFRTTTEAEWWALDLFAEVRDPIREPHP